MIKIKSPQLLGRNFFHIMFDSSIRQMGFKLRLHGTMKLYVYNFTEKSNKKAAHDGKLQVQGITLI